MGPNSEIAFSVFGLPIRWYALAYLAGIFVGYWYLLKLIAQPGAPMARRHADDMIFYAMLGIILGGRLGYVIFYNLGNYVQDPVSIFKLWDGGMSLHGGVVGVLVAIWYVTRKDKLSFLRFCDYVACVVPFGLFFGRLANFVNGELWGRATTVPWAIIFPDSGTMDPRHPSQLYEAGLEGIVMMAVLAFLFWRTDARYKPGFLFGTAAIIYGLSRFAVEFVREPDVQLGTLSWGLTMGQTLTIPMLLAGAWLVVTAKGRRHRVEPIAGPDAVA
nr:prolipoprotein diacylglyceryl transferase [Sphingopyxis chilensis]